MLNHLLHLSSSSSNLNNWNIRIKEFARTMEEPNLEKTKTRWLSPTDKKSLIRVLYLRYMYCGPYPKIALWTDRYRYKPFFQQSTCRVASRLCKISSLRIRRWELNPQSLNKNNFTLCQSLGSPQMMFPHCRAKLSLSSICNCDQIIAPHRGQLGCEPRITHLIKFHVLCVKRNEITLCDLW